MKLVTEGIDLGASMVEDEARVLDPWTMVHKPKRARKHKFESTKEVKEVERTGCMRKLKILLVKWDLDLWCLMTILMLFKRKRR